MNVYSFILISAVFVTGMCLSYLTFEEHYKKGFVISIPNTEDINSPAENCRKAVEDMNIPHAASGVSEYLTISEEAVSLIPDKDSSPGDLVNMADNALYKAKVNGRNRVVTV